MNLKLLIKSLVAGTMFFSTYFLIVILTAPNIPPQDSVFFALRLNGIFIFGWSLSLSIQTWLSGYPQTVPLQLSLPNKVRHTSRSLILIGAVISVFFSFFTLIGAGYCRILALFIFGFILRPFLDVTTTGGSPILWSLFQYSALLAATGLGIMLLSNVYTFVRLRKKMKIYQKEKQKGRTP